MAGGFRNVRPSRETREMAGNRQAREGLDANLQGQGLTPIGNGQFTARNAEGPAGGDANFYDDPTVNALVDLPSVEEAKQYTGANPSFYGVQRPGDWQRKVQREMAAEKIGELQLTRMQKGERERQKRISMTRPGYGLT